MSNFIIDVPVPSMGATVSELSVIKIAVEAGTQVVKGQKLAALESDKSAFDFESPCDGKVLEVRAKNGGMLTPGEPFLRMETADSSLKHLEVAGAESAAPVSAAGAGLIWTPKAIKVAQEAGLDHTTIADIKATGPGNRVSGDDVTRYLAAKQ